MGKIDELTNEASAMQKPVSDIAERGGSGAIAQLIQQYCPDGVEYVKLDEIGSFYSGLSGKSKEDFRDGNAKFITYVNIFNNPALNTDVEDKVKIADGEKQNTIQYGDLLFTGSSETPDECGMCSVLTHRTDENLYLNSFCFGFRFNDLSDKCPSFMKHLFRSTSIRKKICKTANGVTRYNISKKEFAKIEIPHPPLPVQEEIVRILDNFTNLAAELQAELQARREQYLYYQHLLLNKTQYSKHITIGELCVVKKGNTPIQKAKEGEYPLVATTMERRSCNTFQFNTNAVCIPLVSSRGHGVASLNHIYYQEGMFALGNILCAVIPDDERVVKAKYLYYYLEYAKDYTLVPLMKGGANVSLHCSDIEKVKIPLPSLSEQERIISILDRFHTLTNDLSQGLPAEIEARQQQYEYYRDQLLTFKRKEA